MSSLTMKVKTRVSIHLPKEFGAHRAAPTLLPESGAAPAVNAALTVVEGIYAGGAGQVNTHNIQPGEIVEVSALTARAWIAHRMADEIKR